MISIKDLTVKNFMSVGNQTQAINFDQSQLTLVLGENLDLGGDDSGARNGTGKTTIVNALSYAIYGQALTNIKRDNLVNKINSKAMLVTVTFEKNSVEYKIERGRKPNLLKFTINGKELESEDQDESQGDSRETQKAIEEIFSMSHPMFKHLVALNTYTEPFLSMRAAEQREIIEQLLGITQLSEKAEALKISVKETKDQINTESTKIETIDALNKKISENIAALERKQTLWQQTQNKNIDDLEKSISLLENIDIDQEIQNQKDLEIWNKNKKELDNLGSLLSKQISSLEKEQKLLSTAENDLKKLNEHRCHACGQDLHNDAHQSMKDQKLHQITEYKKNVNEYSQEIDLVNEAKSLIGELADCPKVIYDSLEQSLNHKNTLENLKKELDLKHKEKNPYDEQIEDLKNTALQEIDYTAINNLSVLKEHQEFLYKLLTNKDSFVRKKIIDQNLTFLNQRLTYYLSLIGLPHLVEFQNDLSVIITQLGQDLDFDNLSRGERNRLILSLSWAFRDVWENLYSPVNLLFIDELVDSGMDASGVESSISILKKFTRERNKSIFLISHRDDLTNRVNRVLRVIKENGFTSYENDVELV